MEILYLVLTLAFLIWIAQILLSFRRQADRIVAQIQRVQESQEEVLEEAERLETTAKEKTEQAEGLQSRLDNFEREGEGTSTGDCLDEGRGHGPTSNKTHVEGGPEADS